MNRHLWGGLVFSVILVGTFSTHQFIRSINDWNADLGVAPVTLPPSTNPDRLPDRIRYESAVATLDENAQAFKMRLTVDRSELGNSTRLYISGHIGEEPRESLETYRFEAIGHVLPGTGDKAIVMVEVPMKFGLSIGTAVNLYARVHVSSTNDVGDHSYTKRYGESTPIVLEHRRKSRNSGQDILR